MSRRLARAASLAMGFGLLAPVSTLGQSVAAHRFEVAFLTGVERSSGDDGLAIRAAGGVAFRLTPALSVGAEVAYYPESGEAKSSTAALVGLSGGI